MTKVLNKAELVSAVHERSSASKAVVESVITDLLDVIKETLVEGGEIHLRGLMTLATQTRKAHIGRNPKTGEAIEVPKRRVPYAKFGATLRSEMNA